ncbi:MAG: PAS domain S-box protein [Planctomycetes bacterium]|nr:PAS domain S-box protein [Planctomycetota bacterium]
MFEFVAGLFDTSGFVPRAQCGNWTPRLIWLHIISDLLIWIAYVSIPIILLAFARRKELPFPRVFVLFALFILACGSVHFVEAVIFFEPIYRFSGVLKALTAAVSLMTVVALVPLVRRLFTMEPGKLLAVLEPGRAGGFGVRGVSVWVTAVWIAAVIVLVANTAVSSININALIYNEELITHTRLVKQELSLLLSDMKDAETGHRGFQITSKGSYLVPFFDGTRAARQRVIRLEAMTADNSDQIQDAAVLKELISTKIDEMGRTFLMHVFQGREAAQLEIGKDEGRQLMDDIRATVARMDAREDHLLAERATVSKNKYRTTTVTSLLGGGMALGMVMLGYGLIRWELGRRLLAENIIQQRETQLARSEDQFRTLATAVPQIVWVARPDGSREYYNAKWYEYTGMTEEETLGWGWSKALHPDDKARGEARWKQSYETGCEYEIEYRMRGADGNYRWYLGRALPQRDDSGAIVRWFGSSTDITDRRKAEDELADRARVAALRAGVATALAAGSETLVALQGCAETLVHNLGAALARIWTLDPTGVWLELQASAGMYTHTNGAHSRVRVGDYKIGAIAATRTPHLTNDVPNDPKVSDPAWAKREGLVSFAGYPLIVDDRVLGVVALFSRQKLTDGVVTDLNPIAASIAQYVQRRRVEAAIRTSEERYRTLTEAIPQIVWNATPDGEVSYFNHRWLEYTQLPLEGIRGKGWLAAAHPGDQERVLTSWRNTVANAVAGTVDRFREEVRLRRGDTGEFRWFLTVAVPLRRVDGGGVDQWIGSMADIHDQKTAAEVIRESEEKFRQLAESIPQLAWMTDADGYIFWYNQRWYDYTGTTFQEMKGWGWQAVQDPAEAPRVIAKFKAHIISGEPWEDTFPLRRADGVMRWHLSRARPIRDEAGRVVRWFGTNTDITEQRELEQKLRAGEERFRTLTEAVPQMVWTANPTGEVTFFNRRWDEYTGMRLGQNPDDRKPGEWSNVVHPDDAEQLRADWQLAVAHQPERFSDEFRLKRASDGEYRWMLSTAVPLRGAEGVVTEWVGSITDIDDQKRQSENLEWMVRERTAALVDEVEERRLVEQRVRAVAAELARSNAELEQFAYVASHDLQEPLRKIQAFGDRLRNKFRDQLPDGGKDYVDRMLNSAGRMRQLIDDLLSFSRVTSQSRPFVRVELGKIVREVVSDLSVRIEQTGGEVRISELPEIDADAMQMRQLFQNLIANALKFQRPDVPPIVEVQGELVTAPPLEAGEPSIPSCRLTVKDNGIGFDTKYLDRIFQVFQRLHGREEYEGTGVGLAICRKIAERHAGTITAASQLGEGATFTVILPVRQPRLVAPLIEGGT